MSTAKKQRTTSAAADDTPKASSTPIHPWVKLMTKHNLTLEEVAKHTCKVHAFEGLSFEPEKNQDKLEPPTRLKTNAPSKPVKKPAKKPVNVFLKEETEAQTFDYLVVAANPRELMGYNLSTPDGSPPAKPISKVLAPTLKEEAVYGKAGMHNSYFHTTVIKVEPKDLKPLHIVQFSPTLNRIATGEVMGYRNETRLALWHDTLEDGETVTEEYLTLYQLSDPDDPIGSDPKCEVIDKAGLQKKFDEFIKNPPSWFPYKMLKQEATVFHTPYFNRFPAASLNKGLLWDLLDIQGQNYTTFTHGSSCFESVLQIHQYLEMLKEKGGLPTDKTASVAIVGAGPSGLLSALFLVRAGFNNITMFEKNQDPDEDEKLGHLYAGKSRTVKHELGAKASVVCEMGTCYLSPAYKHMVDDLQDYFDGTLYGVDSNVYAEPSILLSSASEFDPAFRAMDPTGQFKDDGPIMRYADLLGDGLTVPAGGSGPMGGTLFDPFHPFKDNGVTNLKQPINFGEYMVLKAMEMTCSGPPEHGLLGGKLSHLEAKIHYDAERLECTVKLGEEILKYCLLHKKLFGDSTPFPAERISPTDMKLMTIPFSEWLEHHSLTRLTGFLQYGYSVQGYGSLERVPAFYGFVWIPPSVLLNDAHDIIASALTHANPELFDKLKRFAKKNFNLDLGSKGVVFALKKGWGQVWVNMRKYLVVKGVEFKWSAELERIERDGVKTAK